MVRLRLKYQHITEGNELHHHALPFFRRWMVHVSPGVCVCVRVLVCPCVHYTARCLKTDPSFTPRILSPGPLKRGP